MDPTTETWVRAGAALVGALAFAALLFARLGARARVALAVSTALLGLGALYNFGVFRHHDDTTFVNQWEHFHYHLGARYFPELGYDGLYAASLAAQAQTQPDVPPAPFMRDLRDNRLVPPRELVPFIQEVTAGFTPERWRSFVDDHTALLASARPGMARRIRSDHGYNPSPAWTFVGRLFGAPLDAGPLGSHLLAGLDVALLALLLFVVARTVGLEAACLTGGLIGLGFGWRYLYIGAFLRLDWLAAIGLGCCSLRTKRWGWAGACFGYAAAVRLFPVLFLVGPGLLALREWIETRSVPRWSLRLLAGFSGVFVALLLAGCLTGRGPGAWSEFAHAILLHRDTWAVTRVGFDNLLLNDPVWMAVGFGGDVPPVRTFADIERLRAERTAIAIAGKVLLLCWVGFAAWRATLVEAALLGCAVVFALTPAGGYYWIMLALLPIAGAERRFFHGLAALFLGLGAFLYAHQVAYPAREMEVFRFGLMSWALLGLFVLWGLCELRGRRTSRAP